MTDKPTELKEWREKQGQDLFSIIKLGDDAYKDEQELTVFLT